MRIKRSFWVLRLLGVHFFKVLRTEVSSEKPASQSIGPSADPSELARVVAEAENVKGRFYLINTTQTASR